jgi:hypothetical protein
MGGACSTNGEKSNAYRLWVVKQERQLPLEKPRRRWVDNIKVDLGEVRWGDVDVESSCECGSEPSGSIKCWETIECLHNCSTQLRKVS